MEMHTLEVPPDLKIRYLERMGHQIKGNALSFGYPELETIGRDVEEFARERNKAELVKCFLLFSDWVKAQD